MAIQDSSVFLRIRLREAMERHCERTGERLTYETLAQRTGLARPTVESIATRSDYSPSLRTIARLCEALACAPGDLLELQGRSRPRKAARAS